MKNNATFHDRVREPRSAALRRRLLPLLVAGCFAPASIVANPVGPQVVNGQASFAAQGNVLSITNTPGAIINWQSFSINPGEVTRFLQQNPNSSVLNRIVGQDPSQILGALQSNGRVFLVNPNGILFGQGAQVDVNGLVASTLNISNEDFIAGRMQFKAGDKAAALKNQGAITTPAGGKVYLIAPNIDNSGIITSPQGEVLLAAGHTVQLIDSLDPNLQVVLSAPSDEALNLGQVIAQGGRTGIYGALVRQRGVVNANSAVVGENGKVVFKASGDAILEAGSRTSATGTGKGGEVLVLGERVGMADGAQIDASGRTGGGTVLVGGDYQGKNTSIRNASRTFFGQGAEIKADALDNGNGGKVIVWADDTARAYGSISARGGQQGGDGGLVETSGKTNLEYRAKVDVAAPAGRNGTLLLDPAVITIAGGSNDGAADGNSTFQGTTTSGTINFADAGPTTIYQSELQGLNPGTNIVLEASDLITTSGSFSNLVTLPSNANLTMRTRNASTDGTGSIGIDLVGSSDGPNLEFKTQGTGTITMQTGTGTSPQSALITVGKLTTGGGAISLNGTGSVVLRAATTTPASGNGGDISITSGGFMTLGGGHIDARAGGPGTDGTVTLTSGGAINMQAGKYIYARNLKMSSAGAIGDGSGGAMETGVAFLNVRNTAASGDINISNTALSKDLAIDAQGTTYGIAQGASGGKVKIKNAAGKLLTVSASVSTTNAGTIALAADKMAINAAVNASNGAGRVELVPVTGDTAIDVASSDVADGTAKLELSIAELNKVSAGTLLIGDMASGSLTIKNAMMGGAGGALQNVSTALSLKSGGVITQDGGATIEGGSSVQATGAAVTLMESNGTGVIAGVANSGDFKYTSYNGINVNTIDGVTGITTPSANLIQLKSTHATAGIGQAALAKITGGELNLETPGPVTLNETGNSVTKVVAALNPLGNGTGGLSMSNGRAAGWEIGAITTKNKAVTISSTAGTATVSGAINAGTGAVTLSAPSLEIASSTNITGGEVSLTANSTDGTGTVTQGSGGSVTGSTNLKVVADKMDFGGTMIGGSVGNGGQVNLHTNTSGRALEIAGATANPGALSLTQANLNAINPAASGVTAGSINFTASGGAIQFKGNYASPGGMYTNMFGGSIGQDALTVISGYLHAVVTGNIDLTQTNAISKLGSSFNSSGTTSSVKVKTSVASLQLMGAISAGSGGIDISNIGGSILAANAQVSSTGGVVKLSASGDMTITASAGDAYVKATGGAELTVGGDLTFNNSGGYKSYAASLSSAPLKLTFNNATGKVFYGTSHASTTTSGDNGFFTGGVPGSGGTAAVSGTSLIVAGGNPGTLTTTQTPTNPPSAPPPPPPDPTLDQCVANPSQAGCNTVLPTLSQCTTAPTTAGCSVVLPTVSQCTTAPTTAGCSAVLPTLSQCTTAPTTAGCSVVLPTLSQCTTAPMTAGCSVVLPTLSQCTTAPMTAGCSVVLPTLSQCTTAPMTAGCSVVLPTLSQCTIAPTTAGCSVVLPTLSQCTTAPTTAGCSVVLPTLSQCTAAPTTAGCSVVLPTLSQCTAAPTTAGCSVVLPTLSQCTTAPMTAGCSVVLPTLSQCTAAPMTAGCSVVLPTLSRCTAAPTTVGCSVVLPTLSRCTTAPTTAGCSAVLPTLSQCIASSGIAGCSAVLPTVAACTSLPSAEGCSVVLPTLSQCTSAPATAGCSVVLPALAACSSDPNLSGCGAVLPTIAQCSATPTREGCSTVVPIANKCTTNPSAEGCSTVLPMVPPTQRNTLAETIASTSNTIVTTTVSTTISNTVTSSESSSTAPQTQAVKGSGSGGSKSESKDEAKDDKKNTGSQQDNGVKKNEIAKKLYCN
ncbi:filamentous hemagglutinin N-terminal domain-containing protein [Noviherbaspirillum saxi]|uniref:Filamentous hemagglutinin N-terminal domain-containing protein n=1 Tax=Noviherbaspirillum saxi TaxID=2320863 RepID=A0A3A3FSS3_9BURK|nr:filamentous hemagglutinin N-terminal domain-containing protein [Noviherbaspirillum saxi]RJF99222.1 filamentous hemagglutinin N-terminal domain-containing protein [Noviherbaspirillum saxi]